MQYFAIYKMFHVRYHSKSIRRKHIFFLSQVNLQLQNQHHEAISRPRLFSDSTSEERLSRYSFWNERYGKLKSSTTFDWFLDSSQLLEDINHQMEDLFKNTSHSMLRYLELGCGNSALPLSIYRESPIPVFVIAMDYVAYAAQQQIACSVNTQPKNRESLFQAVCGDVMKLPFKHETLDLAVDKGTMDALLKDKDKGHINSCKMLSEVMKALTSSGRYIQISDEDPDSRLDLLHNISQSNEPLYPNKHQFSISDTNNNIVFRGEEHRSENIEYKTTEKDVKLINPNLYSFQDIRNDVARDIIHGEMDDSSNWILHSNSTEKSKCSPWKFKVIADKQWDKEYFIYWTEKR